MRTKSDIIHRALEIAYPSQSERDAALRRFAAMPPHHRDTVRTLLRLAFEAVEAGREMPTIPDWLTNVAFENPPKPKLGREPKLAARLVATPPPKAARPLPEFTYEERSGTATARTVRACAKCGKHPKADEGSQRIGGRLLCPKCAAERFKAVNTPHPDEPNVESGKL